MDIGKAYSILNDNRNTIKLFLTALCITLFFSGYIQNILINTCIFGYLAFHTMKFLIGSSEEHNKEKNKQSEQEQIKLMTNLLKYWTSFSALIVAEYFLSLIFSFVFMSIFYNAIKVVGLIMLLQNSKNLLLIWSVCLVPLFNQYEQLMEQAFGFLEDQSKVFRETSNTKEVNYSVYTYIEPYVNKALSFVTSVKVQKQKKLD